MQAEETDSSFGAELCLWPAVMDGSEGLSVNRMK